MLAIRTAIGGHIGAITYCYCVRWKAPVFVIIRFPINRSQACKNSLMKNLSVHHNYSGDVAGISRMVRLSTCLSASESLFFTARCYASAVLAMGLCPSVCHRSVFCRNGWMNRARFWHGSFFLPILRCVKRKFGYLQNNGISRLGPCPKLRT